MTSTDPLIEPDKEKYLKIKGQRLLLLLRVAELEAELATFKLEMRRFINQLIANKQ